MSRGRTQGFECSCSESESKSHDDEKKNIMKQESNSESCTVVSKLLLPEDLMIGILSWVPLKCLLNSARYVCKSWATTIDSSHFAEAHLRCARSKPGLYVESLTSRSSSYFLDIKDDVNGQFERTNLGTPPRMGCVVSTCDGILLLRDGRRQTFLVNPIIKYWLQIPPLPPLGLLFGRNYCQLAIAIARVPRTTKFKLFFANVLKVSGAKWYVLYVLRVGIDNSWKEISRKEAFLMDFSFWQLVYNGSNDLYWITLEGVFVMDVDKEIAVEYPLPEPMDRGLFGTFLWMGNRLSCIVFKYSYTTFQIYILDIDSGKWNLHHEMGPFDFVAACGPELDIMCVLFRLWINNQIIIQVHRRQRVELFTRSKTIHLVYNVMTKQLTKIEGVPEGNFEVWLHTNSLVSLPSTPT